MPTNLECLAMWNEMVPQARDLGLPRIRPMTGFHGNNATLVARVESLRQQIASRTLPLPAVEGLGDQTYGVEFELMMPRGMRHHDLAARLSEAGVPTQSEGYNHSNRDHWKVITDGSLGSYARGAEIVSPVLSGMAGLEMIRKVCRVVTELRCKVTRKCGFHVHVGARNRPLGFFQNALAIYQKYQEAIDTVVSPSRRGSENGYCQALSARDVSRVVQAENLEQIRTNDRFRKLSIASYWRHGTIEFRHHQGTIEADKAENWVRLCLKIAAAAARLAADAIAAAASSLEGLGELIGLTQAERNFFRARAVYFDQQLARVATMVPYSAARQRAMGALR